MFIGQGDSRTSYYILEAIFEARHYLHFTGCKLTPPVPAEIFLKSCLSKRLSYSSFVVLPETLLKLQVLESLMNIPHSATMIGDSIGSGDFLYTEKLAGSVRGCMGFVLGDNAPYYSPNTVLQADIRDLAVKPHKILAVYQKAAYSPLYDPLPVSTAKELRRKTLVWPKDIACKIAIPANADVG